MRKLNNFNKIHINFTKAVNNQRNKRIFSGQFIQLNSRHQGVEYFFIINSIYRSIKRINLKLKPRRSSLLKVHNKLDAGLNTKATIIKIGYFPVFYIQQLDSLDTFCCFIKLFIKQFFHLFPSDLSLTLDEVGFPLNGFG